MKNLLIICLMFLAAAGYSQDKEPTYTIEGDLVKATYYYENGAIKTQGYFKDKKLTGEWTRFDKNGNKTQLAYYDSGKKVGKWFVWTKETLKEINYENNVVVNVNVWKSDTKVASNR